MGYVNFMTLETSVRREIVHQECDVLSCYVHAGLSRAMSMSCASSTKRAHLRVVNTLTETMCDTVLSTIWRKKCYRVLKQYMPILYEVLEPQSYYRKADEIKLLHEYFVVNVDSDSQGSIKGDVKDVPKSITPSNVTSTRKY